MCWSMLCVSQSEYEALVNAQPPEPTSDEAIPFFPDWTQQVNGRENKLSLDEVVRRVLNNEQVSISQIVMYVDLRFDITVHLVKLAIVPELNIRPSTISASYTIWSKRITETLFANESWRAPQKDASNVSVTPHARRSISAAEQ